MIAAAGWMVVISLQAAAQTTSSAISESEPANQDVAANQLPWAAIRESRRAVDLCPESADAVNGAQLAGKLALVYARTGEIDQAITLIERLLRTPGATIRQAFFDGGITQAELRLRWQWDPLRANPRFRKILEGPEPKNDLLTIPCL